MAFMKSPWVIHYDGSSATAATSRSWTLARLRRRAVRRGEHGHSNTPVSSRHRQRERAEHRRRPRDLRPGLEPKVVVACGICACTGRVFHDCYNVIGSVDKAIPSMCTPGCCAQADHRPWWPAWRSSREVGGPNTAKREREK
ncbi:MAG: NADH-quinone oxidoreductase subunit B [Adlercreutzia equolifaciens]